MFPLNRSPDFAVPVSRSTSHMRFAMQWRTLGCFVPLTVAGQWRIFTAFPCIQRVFV